MKSIWRIEVQDSILHLLNQKLLGLTFFERRLREAKQLGISKVIFISNDPSSVQIKLRSKKHCADYSIQKSIPSEVLNHFEVIPLMSLIDLQNPTESLFSIHNKNDFKEAQKILQNQIIQGSGAGWVSKHLNKPISFFISTFLSQTFITPNLWTLFNFFIGMCAAYCVSQTGYMYGLVGGFLLQLASIFDGVDGEIAKFRLETSRLGSILDSFADNGTLLAFIFGISFYLITNEFSKFKFLPFLIVLTFFLVFLLIIILWRFVKINFSNHSLVLFDKNFLQVLPSSNWMVRFAWMARNLIKKDFFSAFFFFLCILGLREWVIYLASLGSLVGIVVVLYLTRRFSVSETGC